MAFPYFGNLLSGFVSVSGGIKRVLGPFSDHSKGIRERFREFSEVLERLRALQNG